MISMLMLDIKRRGVGLLLCFVSAAMVVAMLASSACLALEPSEVLVIANGRGEYSVRLASFYMGARNIPDDNLLVLSVDPGETISRNEYDEAIADPVRERLNGPDGAGIKALALVYGMPLRVNPPEPDETDARIIEALDAEHKELWKDYEANREKILELRKKLDLFKGVGMVAAIDSELALALAGDYPLDRWVANPLYRRPMVPKRRDRTDKTLLVARLDGPSPASVERIIKDGLEAEETGISGKAYLDARMRRLKRSEQKNALHRFDNSLWMAGDVFAAKGIDYVIDDRGELFEAGSELKTGLYCGWYKLGEYVDAFDWQRGGVGYHVASGECVSLKSGKRKLWCRSMLEDGAAAVVGPVAEPYLHAFPPPHLFFELLTSGDYTLAEVFGYSSPLLSWRMILVGDPLYNPFKTNRFNGEPVKRLHAN